MAVSINLITRRWASCMSRALRSQSPSIISVAPPGPAAEPTVA
jgi:hypothetical protein